MSRQENKGFKADLEQGCLRSHLKTVIQEFGLYIHIILLEFDKIVKKYFWLEITCPKEASKIDSESICERCNEIDHWPEGI